MYNPAANLINQTITDDPTIVQGYQIKAYNNARKGKNEEEAKKSGLPVDQLKKQWVKTQLGEFDKQSNKHLEKENVELNNTRSRISKLGFICKRSSILKVQKNTKNGFIAMTKGQTIQKGINKLEQKRNNILNGPD